jgi:hypothetical protein
MSARISAAVAGFTFCLLALPTRGSAQSFGGEDFWFKRMWLADRCYRITVQQDPVSRTPTSDGLVLTVHVPRTSSGAFCSGNSNRSFNWNSLGFRAQWADEDPPRKGHTIILRRAQDRCFWGCEQNGWIYTIKIDSVDATLTDRVYLMIDSDDGTHIAEFVGNRVPEF